MFCSTSLAARIETAEARLTSSIGTTLADTKPGAGVVVQALGGGVAVFAGPLSPMNKMIGLGFGDLPADHELQAVEDVFSARGAVLQAEVSTLASPAVLALLGSRGYVIQGFENVLGRPLSAADAARRDGPKGASTIDVMLMPPGDERRWLDVAVTSFMCADTKGVQAEPLPPRADLERSVEDVMFVPGFRHYTAWLDGQLAGVATLRLDDGLAQLCGAGTLPEWRRRGVQAALLSRRLSDAREAGCDVALMTTAPGTTSQENGFRQGFALLYSRALLVKAPAIA